VFWRKYVRYRVVQILQAFSDSLPLLKGVGNFSKDTILNMPLPAVVDI
jgi:hypothetical protein